MKHLFYLLLAAAMFASCSSDEELFPNEGMEKRASALMSRSVNLEESEIPNDSSDIMPLYNGVGSYSTTIYYRNRPHLVQIDYGMDMEGNVNEVYGGVWGRNIVNNIYSEMTCLGSKPSYFNGAYMEVIAKCNYGECAYYGYSDSYAPDFQPENLVLKDVTRSEHMSFLLKYDKESGQFSYDVYGIEEGFWKRGEAFPEYEP